ncbi:hypothetical protein B0H94_105114 [Salsuginibacillus halophilus]|uniref:Uncharacterized protein n=1 Tax=Salsuginibacillus halophilus TaxID=517424 RepID=A0A2P8HL81_9BACI|nr:hypothetical protein [Salsuginibacillus halophilus]PSL46961.1 hypothetical protein B0H94_105114 [Salsuginibacillus halophilus]
MGALQGCSIGFWGGIDNLSHWEETDYDPDDLFNTIFGRIASEPSSTLFVSVNLPGGGTPPNTNNLIRQSVAALLNASHPDINFQLTPQEVITQFQVAWDGGQATRTAQGELFDQLNTLGCPLS